MYTRNKIAICLLLLVPAFAFTQYYQLSSTGAGNEIKIHGTSSLHDWECPATKNTARATMEDNLIKGLSLSVVTKGIISESSIMDGKIYDSLKADKFPNIEFSASELKVVDNKRVTGSGTLKIVGKSKSIPVDAQVSSWNAADFTVTGKVSFKMTDFGITPPTAMFGTLKTGDDITITYKIKMNKK